MAQVTGVTGGGGAINNYQPSLVLTQTVRTAGLYPSRDGGGAGSTIGMIHTFAGNFGPYGQPQAQGQLQSISQNIALFSLVGTTYGGNGQTNFALPNLAGTAAMGAGQGPGLTARGLGEQVGAGTNIMTLSQLPSHDHGLPGGGVTGLTGGNAPLNNMHPSLALNYQIAVDGIYPSRSSGGSSNPFIGQVSLFTGNFATGGYLLAQGQSLAISEYDALFSILGTTYGGDGVNTFRLPDLQGRVAVGTGNGVNLGDVFGSQNTFLTGSNLPGHLHTLSGGGFTDLDGGGQPFNNLQPSLGLNYLIALQGLFPSRDGSGGGPEDTATLGEIVTFAGNFAPSGYAFANGQLLPINQNQALFSILGTTYGGNGQTTFALPDLRGRTILGAGGEFQLGQSFGENSHILSVAELPSHLHTLPAPPQGAIPEPSTWAMMIIGFGAAGSMIRRRKAVVA